MFRHIPLLLLCDLIREVTVGCVGTKCHVQFVERKVQLCSCGCYPVTIRHRQACTNERCARQPVNGFQIWHTLQACHRALQIARVAANYMALNWAAFAVNGTSCSSTCGVVAPCQSLTVFTLQHCPELSSGLSSMLASAQHISIRARAQDMQP